MEKKTINGAVVQKEYFDLLVKDHLAMIDYHNSKIKQIQNIQYSDITVEVNKDESLKKEEPKEEVQPK